MHPRKQEKWERIWEYHKQADTLFHQRFSFFLVAESMLITSLMLIINQELFIPKLAIIMLGLVFTFGWFYMNARILRKLKFLTEEYLKKIDHLYAEYMSKGSRFEKRGNPLTPERHLSPGCTILPISTFLFWSVMLLYLLKPLTLLDLHLIIFYVLFIIGIAIILRVVIVLSFPIK